MTNKRQFFTNVKEIADAIKKVYHDAEIVLLENDETNDIRNKG